MNSSSTTEPRAEHVRILVNHNLSHLFALNFPLGFTIKKNFGIPKGAGGGRAKRNRPLTANVTQYGSAIAPYGSGSISVYRSAVRESAVGDTKQKRALPSYRTRLRKRGMARFEVRGLDADRELIRSLARRLAKGDHDAAQIRAAISRAITGEPPKKGGILAALRRSPLVGADLTLARSHEAGRKFDLRHVIPEA